MAFHYGGASRDEGKTFDIFCLEVCIFQAGYFFTSYVAVFECDIFNKACRMSDQREGFACIGPVDILQVDTLYRAHPAVTVTLSFGQDYLQILIFDVRFDPYILKCDVPNF